VPTASIDGWCAQALYAQLLAKHMHLIPHISFTPTTQNGEPEKQLPNAKIVTLFCPLGDKRVAPHLSA